jgi:hypothetical protein
MARHDDPFAESDEVQQTTGDDNPLPDPTQTTELRAPDDSTKPVPAKKPATVPRPQTKRNARAQAEAGNETEREVTRSAQLEEDPTLGDHPKQGKEFPELPASYQTESGLYRVNVTRPWGPVVVSVLPKGWHGGAPLDLPLEELGGLIKVLQAAWDAHEGQV